MYKNVLVPVAPDDIEHAASAFEVARQFLGPDGTLHVLTVLEVPPRYLAEYLPDRQANDVIKWELDRQKEQIQRIAKVDPVIVNGHPAGKILDEAQRLDVDCIVITSHASGVREFFLGSTAARVARRARCSVMIVR
ncbi:MAG: universal stress protein [Pseudomonadota bacterium]